MAEGQLRCAGSSLFLKKMYGVGYQLTIEKQSRAKGNISETAALVTDKSADSSEVFADSEIDEIKERKIYDVDEFEDECIVEGPVNDGSYGKILNKQIKTAVPEATLLNDVGTEIRYQLPIGASDKFVSLFEELDREVDAGKIVSYGVSITTLGKCLGVNVIKYRSKYTLHLFLLETYRRGILARCERGFNHRE
jgi:ATP-binding cassette, subfamily A (ABC1), member 3